jgi:hypothetical protein
VHQDGRAAEATVRILLDPLGRLGADLLDPLERALKLARDGVPALLVEHVRGAGHMCVVTVEAALGHCRADVRSDLVDPA